MSFSIDLIALAALGVSIATICLILHAIIFVKVMAIYRHLGLSEVVEEDEEEEDEYDTLMKRVRAGGH